MDTGTLGLLIIGAVVGGVLFALLAKSGAEMATHPDTSAAGGVAIILALVLGVPSLVLVAIWLFEP